MVFDIWELLALYELAGFSLPVTYQDLVREAVERGARILGLRRLAIILEENGRTVTLGHWGFGGGAPAAEGLREPGEGALVHVMSRGVRGRIYLETQPRASARERRLLRLFARRLEDVIAAMEMERKTRQSERAFRAIFNNVQEAVFIFEPGGRVLEVNRSVPRLYGLADREEALGRSFWEDYSAPDCPREEVERWRAQEAEESLYLGWPARRPGDGSVFEAEIYFTRMVFSGREALLATVRDVSERKRREDLLHSIFERTPIGMYLVSEGRFEMVNPQFEQLSGYSREELLGRESLSLVFPEDREKVRQEAVRMLKGGEARPYEFRLVTKDGGLRWMEETVTSWEHGGRRVTLGNIIDVTEKKRFAQRLEYVSLHDQLTGLYNRVFFEEEMRRLSSSEDCYPVSVIVADVNGLKLMNDTLGHHRGDELLVACARILQRTLRRSDVVARVGGDEFVALLPNTDEAAGTTIIHRLQAAVEEHNRRHPELPLSVSFGLATASAPEESLRDTYRQADDRMYREKLYSGTTARSQIVHALVAALAERDHFAGGHARRLEHWCRLLAERLGLPSRQRADLALLAQVHDIGKIGIPDTVLLKPGPLTDEEWAIMRQHPVKGYRIALATPELAPVADLILKHHERWDGSGYPLGLKGEEIPIECRILAVVDAFDVMTSDRPYRRAKSFAEAVEEIRRGAGTQFDPDLAALFLEMVSEREWREAADPAQAFPADTRPAG
ncbi:MAG: PAS domain S-box protein [Moorellales bacterium]